MGVLNFAHGAFITVGSYGTWWVSMNVFDGVDSTSWRLLLSALVGLVVRRRSFAALVELVLIRPLYSRHIEQVLVTVGLQLAFVALITGIWGPDAKTFVVRSGCTRRPTSAARTSRTTAGSRSRPPPPCSPGCSSCSCGGPATG